MTGLASIAARVAGLNREQRRAVLAGMSAQDIAVLEHHWMFWARPDQLPPPGDWRTWLLRGGRGAGKTRSAAEWVRAEAESGRRMQIGIVGPTSDAMRRVQVEGPSGILAVAPPWCRPSYEPSRRIISWPNGCIAHLFTAEEPDRLRGPNLDAAWCDEITSWQNAPSVWNMLQMALRLPGPKGDAPRVVVTTTPRAMPLLKAVRASTSTVETVARTFDNAANLDASTLRYLTEKYAGTRLGRQELDAELLEDADGALWTRDLLDQTRVMTAPEKYSRLVVAIDPSGGGKDECGIIVAGRGSDGHGYVIADASGRMSPAAWAQRAVSAYYAHQADRIVAEQNYGGATVEATIRAVDPAVPIKLVNASRGKQVRAEPIAAFFEQRRAHIVGNLPQLEDELCQWAPNSNMPSPGRLDAMVWALTELIGAPGVSGWFQFYKEQYEEAWGPMDPNNPRPWQKAAAR